jgi:hypothetical protein
MKDRTNVEINGLEAAKGALDIGQALVSAHRIRDIESIGWHAGAQHEKPSSAASVAIAA